MPRGFKLAAALIGSWLFAVPALAQIDGRALYQERCASCHGMERLGGVGPALLPENLGRLKGAALSAVISDGRVATQMPSFREDLSPPQIEAIANYVATPLKTTPVWGMDEINASRSIEFAPPALAAPTFASDPLNLFVVVETGDHHATILDGDRLESIARFPTRFALHGGPKFSPDGRFVYFMSRDGWIEKYDIWSLKKIGEVRGGVNSRNIALSADGKTIALANYLPHTVVLFDSETLAPLKRLETGDGWGTTSRVSAVYQARPRDSFVVALKDSPQIWEISTRSRDFPVRRVGIDEPLDDFFFDPSYEHVLGSARDGEASKVYNLDTGALEATLTLPGLPHLGSGISFEWNGRPVMATPHLRSGMLSIIAMDNWSVVKTAPTLGPGFFLRSHENTPYAWTDAMMSKSKDTMSILDKRTLEIVRTVTPSPGKTAAHVEFDRRGDKVLVSIWEDPGELVVYDARTFQELKRMPMRKPSGKYNVYNKINFSEGTSH
jgi:mono/diheme cytochrome c family protein/WD40 repeat protein